MKKTYVMPTATKVDFQFETSVVASEPPIGDKWRPSHPSICQWSVTQDCNYNYSSDYNCQAGPLSLR